MYITLFTFTIHQEKRAVPQLLRPKQLRPCAGAGACPVALKLTSAGVALVASGLLLLLQPLPFRGRLLLSFFDSGATRLEATVPCPVAQLLQQRQDRHLLLHIHSDLHHDSFECFKNMRRSALRVGSV